MKTLKDIAYLEGVKVLLRADFNVPVQKGVVFEDFRIRSTLPTINYLRSKGAKVILISHLEAADGSNGSLEPVAKKLAELSVPVEFITDYKKATPSIEALENGKCILLENVRFFEGEKKNDPAFAKQLASLADIYVNDAFSVSHREHASVVGVPKYIPGYAGLQLENEVNHLSQAFKPNHPFLFILGGAKFETKLPLLAKFIEIADTVFVGGALCNDFFKLKGYEIGHSLISPKTSDLAQYQNSPKLMIPTDVIDTQHKTWPASSFPKEEKIMDSGAETVRALADKINEAKFILWNGPLGLYEDGYQGATLDLAKLIAEATEKGNGEVKSVVGGGDTLAAINTLGIQDKFTFISTAGGAMLDFLAKGSLPGIEALG